MVDAVRFDEDPDPTFYTNADPDPNFNSFRNIKISNKTYNLIKFNLTTFFIFKLFLIIWICIHSKKFRIQIRQTDAATLEPDMFSNPESNLYTEIGYFPSI